ncbi:hypothetical protein FPQ18DRAFT_392073 [Pyronema domesticum]|nr:hypothetical protein FPQ18DRAFT_392073 [Pyronema domesticum]
MEIASTDRGAPTISSAYRINGAIPTEPVLSVDQHIALLRHHLDGTTLNPADTLDVRTMIRATKQLETSAHIRNTIKEWLVYDILSSCLAFGKSE